MMFAKARIKLTAWYLLIIMLISIFFSIAIYKVLSNELGRVERIQRLRQERQLRPRLANRPVLDPELVEDIKNRLKIILLLINLGIFGTSGLAGYFLAGRTLRPISKMVDEQNRFITDASHELRTPITSLKTEIEVNLRDKKLNEETRKILTSNLEEVNNLQNLSNNLIKLNKYQKTNGNIHFEKISLTAIINQASKIIANLAKHKNIVILNRIKGNEMEGDRQSLTELFVIFLDNAIKYSHKNKRIILTSKKEGSSIIVNIKDEGIGIAEEDSAHLFDRFYRVDKSRTKTESQGYGLGLSIAKKIVSQHNGSIAVESKLGHGTTFAITLPIKRSRNPFKLSLSSIL